jgi:hypothetical protein
MVSNHCYRDRTFELKNERELRRMYIKTKCTSCGQNDYHNIKLHALEYTVFDDLTNATRYTVEHIEVAETVSEEELANTVMRELRAHVHDGVSVKELCYILKLYFGVVANHCCDLIQRLKVEMDMYCPDRNHLYFVENAA